MLREQRSASQILFGFLPEQTVDLQGRVWKVEKWIEPRRLQVDASTLRRELARQAAPWAAHDNDNRFVQRLMRGDEIEVLSLNMDLGVKVESFPNVWSCRACGRIRATSTDACKCGARAWGQLPFVGYHKCGMLREPFVPRCPTHNDVRIVFPGTSSAGELRFECPICKTTLRKGFGFPNCECGDGRLQFNVHRTAMAFTPRSVVIVNPPSPERMKQLERAGGATRALGWVLNGLRGRWVDEGGHTRATFRQQLIDQGIAPGLADSFVDQAVSAGQISDGPQPEPAGSVADTAEAESEAVSIALALAEARQSVEELIAATDAWSPVGVHYRNNYTTALDGAGLEGIELSDRFPVLSGNYAYTRGGFDPSETKLVPFRSPKGSLVVYADANETEALFIRLDPLRVLRWLKMRGHDLGSATDAAGARSSIVAAARMPEPGSDPNAATSGADLLRLVHSMAHWFVRCSAVFAGLDRNSLGELLVPLHCGFFVYAAGRGDFVLGGLQALFETELDLLLRDMVSAEHRCALDPGCERAGGACMACLHLGEPSCRYYNSFLARSTLFGVTGYLSRVADLALTS